jgi:hypothetical protein
MRLLKTLITYLSFKKVVKVARNVDGFVQPGFIRGACRRKLVNFILKPIYGGTGIKASQHFRNDPRVAHKPMLRGVF